MQAVLLTLFVTLFCIATHGQGTIVFQSYSPGFGVDARVYESDGLTPLSGGQFVAELLGGPSASNLDSIATVGFRDDAYTGYFNGGLQTINSVAPRATAWVEVRAWNTASGDSFLQAQASGLSNSWWASPVFTVETGSNGVNPFPPGFLTGLGISPVYLNSIPEPSAFALAGLGAVVVLFRARRQILRHDCRPTVKSHGHQDACLKPNPTVQRTGASRLGRRQMTHQRRLPPVAHPER